MKLPCDEITGYLRKRRNEKIQCKIIGCLRKGLKRIVNAKFFSCKQTLFVGINLAWII